MQKSVINEITETSEWISEWWKTYWKNGEHIGVTLGTRLGTWQLYTAVQRLDESFQALNPFPSHQTPRTNCNTGTHIAKLTPEEREKYRKKGCCYFCKEPGHMTATCPKKTQANIVTQNPTILSDLCTQIATLYPDPPPPTLPLPLSAPRVSGKDVFLYIKNVVAGMNANQKDMLAEMLDNAK